MSRCINFTITVIDNNHHKCKITDILKGTNCTKLKLENGKWLSFDDREIFYKDLITVNSDTQDYYISFTKES